MVERMNTLTLKKQWFVISRTEKIEDSYTFESVLGTGSYGKVWKAVSKTSQQQVAIKAVQKPRVQDLKTFANEVKILKVLDHPNIIKILETFETDAICYIVTDYCEGGELFEKIANERTLSEQQAAVIMRKMFSGVAYCHNQGICHRDIKPENIMLIYNSTDSDIKLIDFGLAKICTENDMMHNFKGTAYYVSPEMIMGNYTNSTDCWSLGVVLYFLLGGVLPFAGANNEEVILRVYNGALDFRHPNFNSVSPLAKDLIARLVMKDTDLRLSANQAFEHPWVSGLAPLPDSPLNSAVYDQMGEFLSFQKLKRATLMFIASRLSEKDVENLKEIFVAMDLNGDGMLSRNEFESGLVQGHLSIDTTHMDDLWQIVDTNDNEKLDYTEFLAACIQCQDFTDQKYLKSAFEYFDTDNDGKITINELREILCENDPVSHQKLEHAIQEVDINGDGSIDYMEFIRMMDPAK